jgi:hypothetical protein
VPGSSGPSPSRNRASPPTDAASNVAPWNESQKESVFGRPVASRASFIAIPTATAPLGANKTLRRGAGAREVSFRASSTATPFVNRRGQNGNSANCF